VPPRDRVRRLGHRQEGLALLVVRDAVQRQQIFDVSHLEADAA